MPLIDSGELKIYYEEKGIGPPLLLIHGLGSSCRDWELQMPIFAEHFRVIALDLRGHGRSGKTPGPYSMAQFAADTAWLGRALDASPAHLLGISLGGMVAFQLALDFPQQVRKLVIVNSVPELIPRSLADRLGFWQRLLIVRLLGMRRMGKVLADRFFPREEQGDLREIFVRRWAENHKPSYLSSLRAAYGWSVKDRLGEIRAPTLVVGAEGDYFPTSEKEAYTAMLPGASLVIIPDSRHALPAERPEVFNQAALDFLLAS